MTTKNKLTCRLRTRTEADYQAIAAVRTAARPEFRSSAVLHAADDRVHPEDRLLMGWIWERDGEAVAVSDVSEPFFMAERGTCFAGYQAVPGRLRPEEQDEVLRHLLDESARHGAKKLVVGAFDDQPDKVDRFERFGFVEDKRQLWTRLDVAALDPDPHRPKLEQLRSDGTEFVSFAELETQGPDWRGPGNAMIGTVSMDVPTAFPMEPGPLEQFEKELEDPLLWPKEFTFMARRNGVFEGISMLFPRLADPEVAMTGLTGTVRERRRTGLATALKTVAILNARERGVKWIYADNEKNNPMYLLNRQLGFQDVWSELVMLKDL